MTESKIGHLHSRRDITLLGLTGTDWGGGRGGERGEAARFSKILKYGVTGHFQNIGVHPFCINSSLFVYPSVLNALPTAAFCTLFSDAPSRRHFQYLSDPAGKQKRTPHSEQK